MTIQPNNEQAVDFLKWYDTNCILVAIHPETGTLTAKAFSDLNNTTALYDWIATRNGKENLYFHVNPTITLRDKKAEKTDIKEVRELHVDIDPRAGEDIKDEQVRILDLLRNPPDGIPVPTIINFSGGGYQAFWKLKEPVLIDGDLTKAAEVERYNIHLANTLGGDNCQNIDRIMRLPGTINIPNKKKASKGRVPALADVVEMTEHSYSLNQFTASVPIRVTTDKHKAQNNIQNVPSITVRPETLDLSRLDEEKRNKVTAVCLHGLTPEYDFDGDRSDAVFWVCCTLIKADVPDEKILGILLNRELGISAHIYEKGEHTPQKYAERQINRALERQPRPGPILNHNDPMLCAREFIAREHVSLKRYNGDFLEYDGGCYREIEDGTVRAWMWHFLDRSVQYQLDKPPVPFQPNKNKVANTLEALQAIAHLDRENVSPPAWIGRDEQLPAHEIIAVRNGLLHLPTDKLLPSSPTFFTRNALDFDYDQNASEPVKWLAFLKEVWPRDIKAISALQEIFGYLLIPDTSQQKIFLLIGPTRSGKGTIARILQRLVGERNVCSPTLNGLGENFGLQPLIGRQLAVISDMRLGRKSDTASIAETLLRISGEDSVSVQRKYKATWEGRIAARFFIITNELPCFSDSSGALGNRFIILQMHQSFLGREDSGLLEKLIPEMTGILHWAIVGWRRLRERGHFIEPSSSSEARQTIMTLSAPIRSFVSECCVLGPREFVTKDSLFEAYKYWCVKNGNTSTGTKELFTKKLREAFPKVHPTRPRGADKRTPCYKGISLLHASQDGVPFR